MRPPSKDATTARPSTRANSNSSGLHSVGIGEVLRVTIKSLSPKVLSLIQSPGAPDSCEKSGLVASIHLLFVYFPRLGTPNKRKCERNLRDATSGAPPPYEQI